MADVQEPYDAAQPVAHEHVLEQAAEGSALLVARPGISVSGKVEVIVGPLDQKRVECSCLARGARSLGNPPPHEGVEQRRFTDIGAAEKRDFGEWGIEQRIGSRERADVFGLPQASFFWRGRSVTRSGARPDVTHSAVIATSRTSSRLGSSNMISVIISSRMARRPLAPVPRFMAFCAIAL